MLAPPPIGDPFASIDFSSELIFTKITGYPVHHCSSITEAPERGPLSDLVRRQLRIFRRSGSVSIKARERLAGLVEANDHRSQSRQASWKCHPVH